ncbi:MAG: cyclase family protein [Acidimicrobiales bacterium]|nr:cyclase family protein [Acidimicrobiales bacterium]
MTGLPAYDALPVREGAPAGSSWGVWGDGDVLGCLNLLTPEGAQQAAGLVRSGRTFPLDLDLGVPDPPLFGRPRLRHEVLGPPGGGSHDDLVELNTQTSTQWDGFRHVAHPVHGHYGGVADEDHGVHHWAARGIVARAVLADVGRWREAAGRALRYDAPDAIEPEDVLGCLDAQGTAVEAGDVLLVRTGWLSWYRSLDGTARADLAEHLVIPGLRPGRATARMLWDLHVAAVAADNPSFEMWPPAGLARGEWRRRLAEDPEETFVHTALLGLLGLPIGELFDLDALAEDCAGDGRYEAMLTSAPLHLRNGAASPPNALAIR